MPKIFDTHAGTDIACEEDETLIQLKMNLIR